MPKENELPELPHFAGKLVPMKVDRRSIPMIQDMASTKFDNRELLESETTTPAGLIIAVDPGTDITGLSVVQAEVVEESNTQRLKRLLSEIDTGDAGQEHEDRLQEARKLSERIERDHAVYVLQWVLKTVFNDEIRANRAMVGQIGNKVRIREELLDKLGKGITELINANKNSV